MPNNVTNLIKFNGKQEDINKVLELIRTGKECIDFNTIIPMPENIFRGNVGLEERQKYGSDNWYDWSIAHWGTKWNAYDSHLDKENNTITFDTAWSCPIPVLDALAEICYKHNVEFEGKWADEDRGYNVGTFESFSPCDEECCLSYERCENCSNQAYDIYVELKGDTECLGKDEQGNWISYSCDDCPHKC